MGIIGQLPYIIEEAERRNMMIDASRFEPAEEWPGEGASCDHRIYRGDNLRLMDRLCRSGAAGSIRMIYIDPPFFTRSDFDAVVDVAGRKIRHPAYHDTWSTGLVEYLIRLARNLLLMRKLLAEDGLLWLHLDWHASHYARVLLDEIFGAERFVNEIIWEYKSGGSTKKRFARKHDNILVYSKSESFRFHPLKEKSYNRGLRPYRFKGVEEFCDDVGWYTLVNMKDVWQLDMVGRTSGERNGYATQKPEKLLERIIECCTDPGDLVADFFCGSGTLGAVAARTGRASLQCDMESLATETALDRIAAEGRRARLYVESRRGGAERRSGDGSVTDDQGGRERAFRALFQVEEKSGLREIRLAEVREFRLPEGLERKSELSLTEALAEDSLSAIQRWSVDPDPAGRVFRPVQVMRRDRQGLPDVCEVEAAPGRMTVKVLDVMGRTEYFDI